MKENLDNKECMVLVLFNDKQMVIYSFKHCALTITTGGSQDLLIHCLKPNWLNYLINIRCSLRDRILLRLLRKFDKYVYYQETIISDHDLGNT